MKINFGMLISWIIFFPLILTMALVTGAIDGLRSTYECLKEDVFRRE